MLSLPTAAWVFIALILGKWIAQLWLDSLNRKHVLEHAGSVPPAFSGIVAPETYAKSVDYTLAKNRFDQIELTFSMVFLLLVLFSGFLPSLLAFHVRHFGASNASMAAFLCGTGLLLALPGLPFDWYSQFHLEQRFGFNTNTPRTWWVDRLKATILSLVISWPLLTLILKIVEWAGSSWWIWAWGVIVAFQLVMLILAPKLILPLFNKLTPLPEGALRDRLLLLGQRSGFEAKSIEVMDGSKRSTHSNAFFTGFGRFRKIVLFDTLIAQLSEPELEAVLAHEIGHYKRKHIPKMLLMSGAGLLAALWTISYLAKAPWFFEAFRFTSDHPAVAFLLFGLLSGAVTFWFSPLGHLLSRKFEYEADHFAAGLVGNAGSLIGALRKLHEKNLSNLTPHPRYSAFYYSHPTLIEREAHLNTLKI
jgi:STE24 endopeptidase